MCRMNSTTSVSVTLSPRRTASASIALRSISCVSTWRVEAELLERLRRQAAAALGLEHLQPLIQLAPELAGA